MSLVAILDADKEGFLRSETSLIQTIGRAARNENGMVIMYADTITGSMQRAISETERRRSFQEKFNKEHGIVPKTVKKDIRGIIEAVKSVDTKSDKTPHNIQILIENLKDEMLLAAENLEFERAAQIRDRIKHLTENGEKNG